MSHNVINFRTKNKKSILYTHNVVDILGGRKDIDKTKRNGKWMPNVSARKRSKVVFMYFPFTCRYS